MALPIHFQFSQSSLEDFEACACRFKLRYLEQLRWPALKAEPVHEAERLAQLGKDFHRLAQQHGIGIAETALTATLVESDAALQRWWQSYLRHRPQISPQAQLYPEISFSTPLAGHRLVARFDLLVVQPDGTFLIIDWKTSAHKPPRHLLAERLQSRVYPFVLAMAGSAFNGGQSINPANIQMIYWYAAMPNQPEQFVYSHQRRQEDEQFLSNFIDQIKHAAQRHTFPRVADKKVCTYCVYRSYCDRGAKAGSLTAWSEEVQEMIVVPAPDWDQLAEIQL